MIPGEYGIQPGDIELSAGRRTLALSVANADDRPVQVGSHYHFSEISDALAFNRPVTRSVRLNIAASTTVHFEPRQNREVRLVRIGGGRQVYGLTGRVMGDLQGPFPAGQVRGKTANTDDRQRNVR